MSILMDDSKKATGDWLLAAGFDLIIYLFVF